MAEQFSNQDTTENTPPPAEIHREKEKLAVRRWQELIERRRLARISRNSRRAVRREADPTADVSGFMIWMRRIIDRQAKELNQKRQVAQVAMDAQQQPEPDQPSPVLAANSTRGRTNFINRVRRWQNLPPVR